jgi:hypothetical protein
MKFKGFKIGKSKEKNGDENATAGGATVTQIAELEEHLNGQTDNLKQTEKKLKKLSGKVGDTENTEDVIAKPHGPIGELSVEPEDDLAIEASTADEDVDVVPEESDEKVKLVEVTAETTTPPPAEKEEKVEATGDSLDKLFSDDEEEENPLASLIRSLPDVDVNELIDDLKEIKDIIKDWQKK